MTLTEKIGNQIRILRVTKRISQKDLCGRIGISQTSMSQIEMGRKFPRPKHIESLEKELGFELKIIPNEQV